MGDHPSLIRLGIECWNIGVPSPNQDMWSYVKIFFCNVQASFLSEKCELTFILIHLCITNICLFQEISNDITNVKFNY